MSKPKLTLVPKPRRQLGKPSLNDATPEEWYAAHWRNKLRNMTAKERAAHFLAQHPLTTGPDTPDAA
jgi:hypothetical protein